MRKFLLLSPFLFFIHFLQAQPSAGANAHAKISGTILDSASGQPLEYATVTLVTPGSGKALTGSTSDKGGHFTVSDVPAGAYTVMVEFIGYSKKVFKQVVINNKNAAVDLKTISLAKKEQSMKGVTVYARGRQVENKIDKLVYNAEKDLTSQGGVASDVLKKVPQVSVDADGNVELSGSSGVRFLIDGKPSSAFGSNISDVLQAIPASQIKSIEVITNPGARYDAQGMGGIINILLKKNAAQGMGGSLSLTGGSRMENGSFNFNARKGTFGLNAFVSGNTRPQYRTPYNSIRDSRDAARGSSVLLEQEGESKVLRQSFQSGLGFDWTYREKNSFTGSIGWERYGNSSSGSTGQTQMTESGLGVNPDTVRTLSYTDSRSHNRSANASLNYKRTFARKDQELNVSVVSSLEKAYSQANTSQLLLPADSLFYGLQNNNPGRQRETQIEVNYAQPLKKEVMLESGAKLSLLDISSQSNVSDLEASTKLFSSNQALSNRLSYHQKVYALYSELSLPVLHLFEVKLGARAERTEINTFYSNAQKQASTPAYHTFVPTVFLSRKLAENQRIKFSYTRRIERPDYEDLNPFINTSDPKNISAGNPYLKPEIGNRIELGYSAELGSTASLMASLFYRANRNDIQPFVVYYPSLQVGDTTYTNVSVSSRENIGIERNTGVNLFASLHLFTKLELRTNLFFFYRDITNTKDSGYDAHSFNYRMNVNASYQFAPTLAGEFFGNFNSPRNEVQGKYPSFLTYSIAFRKLLWNKRGSLALTTTNPFTEYVNQQTRIYGPGFTLNSLRRIPVRSFGLNFTWRFGKLEFKKNKEGEDGAPNEGAEQ